MVQGSNIAMIVFLLSYIEILDGIASTHLKLIRNKLINKQLKYAIKAYTKKLQISNVMR